MPIFCVIARFHFKRHPITKKLFEDYLYSQPHAILARRDYPKYFSKKLGYDAKFNTTQVKTVMKKQFERTSLWKDGGILGMTFKSNKLPKIGTIIENPKFQSKLSIYGYIGNWIVVDCIDYNSIRKLKKYLDLS